MIKFSLKSIFLFIFIFFISCSNSYSYPFLHNQNEYFDVGGYFLEKPTIEYFSMIPPDEVKSFTYFQDNLSALETNASSRELLSEGSLGGGQLSIFVYGEKNPVLSTVDEFFNFPDIEPSNFLPAVYEKLLGTPRGTRLVIILPPKDSFKYLGLVEVIPRNSTVIMVFDLSI